MRFQDKVAIVTGAAGGIGLACARRFVQEGAHVLLADLNEQKLAQAAAQFAPGQVATCVCDVSQEPSVTAAYDAAARQWGRVDVIVNNAGLMIFKPLEDQDANDWLRILNVDLLGAFFFIKQAFRRMQPGGVVVNISSVHALKTEPLVAPYAAAKAALVSLTRSAAMEGRPKKIRVNAVLPGAVDTPMLWDNPNVKSGAETVDKADVGKPEDIAAAVAFLAAPESEFINGAGILVDGGRLDRL
jgi:NAD(P)-dependent dehydrogenase (short-subunit alcohol dehydrogenase family)